MTPYHSWDLSQGITDTQKAQLLHTGNTIETCDMTMLNVLNNGWAVGLT